MNDSLMNLLPGNFIPIDTQSVLKRDSIPFDTTGQRRQWLWRDAQVLYSTVSSQNNYIQINRGSNQGIRDNMGVFSSSGALVGKVVNVGPNFSQVMSLLHVQNKVGVLIRRTGSAGTLQWDGEDPGFLTLNNVPRSDSVVVGDTLVTGNLSLSYPGGHLVGVVAGIVKDASTNFLVLRIKPVVNFANLQQVMVVENVYFEEQTRLNKETVRKVDERK
ncbi:MAG: rod shape-determining protein MreC [Chitinophagaceae bacterium]|nr:rod shape-determining protein MreC [Chitinophagaceae bacterium]